MYSEDAVFVGDYFFWGFAQEVSHVVYFQYGRLGEYAKDVDIQSDIVSLLEMTGLWEDYINIKKTMKDEIAGEPPQAIRFRLRAKPGLFRIEFSKGKIPEICAIKYTEEEARWLTQGTSSHADLEIEKVRNHFLGVQKWLVLNRVHARAINSQEI